MISKILKRLFVPNYYVILDASDNSVTFSKRLFKHLGVMKKDRADVFVFLEPSTKSYGFTLNPDIEEGAPLCQIQYNQKHRCIGFETLCPSVGRIFFDYRIRHDARVKITVEQCKTAGLIWYKILNPNDKHNR